MILPSDSIGQSSMQGLSELTGASIDTVLVRTDAFRNEASFCKPNENLIGSSTAPSIVHSPFCIQRKKCNKN